MGRPTKCTPQLQRRICGLLRKGVPRQRSARLAGIEAGTFHRWMADGKAAESGIYREFYDSVCTAEDELVRRAVASVTDLLGSKADPSVRLNAAKFILSHRFNAEFSNRTEVTGAEGGPIDHTATVKVQPLVSDAALLAATPDQLGAIIGAMVAPKADE